MLFNNNDKYTFQTFDDSPEKRGHLAKILHGGLPFLYPQLEELNELGAGIYATVNETNGRGRKASDIVRIRAAFIDLDTIDHNRTFEYLRPPSLVVESSPGKHHVYWEIEGECTPEQFTELQKMLAELLGGDPKICDPSRVMRFPGFMHMKAEPFLTRIIDQIDRSYTYEELYNWAADALYVLGFDTAGSNDSDRPMADLHDTDNSLANSDATAQQEIDEQINLLLESGHGERNDTLNRVAYVCLGIARAGRANIDEVTTRLADAAAAIGLKRGEILATIKSARSSAPMIMSDLDLLPKLEPGQVNSNISSKQSVVNFKPASGIECENVEWAWHHWLPLGKLTILAGRPGEGKTTIALSIAATISTGGRWPDGTRAKQGKVVIWAGEDDFATTIGPRLLKMGANMDNILLPDTTDENGDRQPFSMSRSRNAFLRGLHNIDNLQMVMVDPLVSASGNIDLNKAAEVRAGLEPLVATADILQFVLLGLAHLNKNLKPGDDPLDKISGSGAFGQLARLCMITTRDREGLSTVSVCKSNNGVLNIGYHYEQEVSKLVTPQGKTIDEAVGVKWGEFTAESANTHLDNANTPTDGSVTEMVEEALQDILSQGPVGKIDALKMVCKEIGQKISSRTLERAKTSIGAERYYTRNDYGGGRKCMWKLAGDDPVLPKESERESD